MRDELQLAVQRLCAEFNLRPVVAYSEVLSQSDVCIFCSFAKGRVEKILRDIPLDEAEQYRQVSLLLKGSVGLPFIRAEDVQLVEIILAAAGGNDAHISPELRDIVEFLRAHRSLWWSLHTAYEKIVQNKLVGTCPIVSATPSFFERVFPFGSKYRKFQEFHKLLHESIHHVLEQNWIHFDDEDLNEGVVTYFHQRLAGPACYIHYTGSVGKKYLNNASLLEKFLASKKPGEIAEALRHATPADIFTA